MGIEKWEGKRGGRVLAGRGKNMGEIFKRRGGGGLKRGGEKLALRVMLVVVRIHLLSNRYRMDVIFIRKYFKGFSISECLIRRLLN